MSLNLICLLLLVLPAPVFIGLRLRSALFDSGNVCLFYAVWVPFVAILCQNLKGAL